MAKYETEDKSKYLRTIFNHYASNQQFRPNPEAAHLFLKSDPYCYFSNNFWLQLDNYFIPLRAICKAEKNTHTNL